MVTDEKMTMNAAILGLLAETSIHPGVGADTGFVDLPVAREAATDYPVIVGSSVKGALLERARARHGGLDCTWVFGEPDDAGTLIVSDARVLLLPVRSMTGHYKWITCPHLIERYERDRQRADPAAGLQITDQGVGRGEYFGTGGDGERLFLEERQFTRTADLPHGLIEMVQPLIRHESTRRRLADQLVVLHDGDFAWFARFGLAINARNHLDDEKKTSKNLWYEETIPPDALFYLLLAERIRGEEETVGPVAQVLTLFENTPYLQVGGNMTIGQGFFAVQPLESQGAAA